MILKSGKEQGQKIYPVGKYFSLKSTIKKLGNTQDVLIIDFEQMFANWERKDAMQPPEGKATTGGVLLKKVFLKILPNSQENTCDGVSF